MKEELMIGDWIMIQGKPYRYYAPELDYSNNRSGGIWITDQSGAKWFSNISDAEPIPLTKEILEKNGLHLYNRKTNDLLEPCNHSDCFEEDENFCLELSLDYNGKIRWSINGDEYTIVPLNYVHELQHAIRICGINKEIIL